MADNFHLIDLVSQAGAVQRLLRGKPWEEKLAWLSERGTISKHEKKMPDWPDTYFFTSLNRKVIAVTTAIEARKVIAGHKIPHHLSDDSAAKIAK